MKYLVATISRDGIVLGIGRALIASTRLYPGSGYAAVLAVKNAAVEVLSGDIVTYTVEES